ncbi:hypothetical protein WKH56_19475 [Priestia sp. SB1]|uniref:hypothetical protein n=1 Tax=Priestia sp. SB1 TaxID=3132359 RepID=UPI00317B8F91
MSEFGDYVEIDINGDRESLVYGELIGTYQGDECKMAKIIVHIKKEKEGTEFFDRKLPCDYYIKENTKLRTLRKK